MKFFLPGAILLAAATGLSFAVATHSAARNSSATQSGSPTAIVAAPTGTPPVAGQQFHADLTAVNGSGVTGSAAIILSPDGKLAVEISATGLEAGQQHAQHIHGLGEGKQAQCPTKADDKNNNGLVEGSEAGAVTGPPILTLTQSSFPVADSSGAVGYSRSLQGNFELATPSGSAGTPQAASPTPTGSATPGSNMAAGATATSAAITAVAGTPQTTSPLDLPNDVIELHGMTVQGVYMPGLPVACGSIEQGPAGTTPAGTPTPGGSPTPGGTSSSDATATVAANATPTIGSASGTPSMSGTSAATITQIAGTSTP